jgi:nitronate monooxygenase
MRSRLKFSLARSLTSKPIAVNLLIPFMRPGSLELLAREKVEAVTFFWGDPAEQIPAAKRLGLTVVWQCGSADEAARAKATGADAIIAQGFEAGGHVRGIVTTLALVSEVRDAIGDLPMLAAGGFADGRGLAAALALGADGAVFGTRSIAAHESGAHPDYKRRIVAAHAAETFHTKLYDVGWPDAAHRTLRTTLVDEWERAGRPESGSRPGEGVSSAKLVRAGLELPLANYSVSPPSEEMECDLGGLAWYAGQSVTQVREVLPAGEIVRRIADEARTGIATRLAPLLD